MLLYQLAVGKDRRRWRMMMGFVGGEG